MTEPVRGCQTLSAYQISMTYLNSRLSYYYFRFRKTNGSHIGILLPVCNLIIYVTLACNIPAKFRRHVTILVKVISIYLTSDMASAATLNLNTNLSSYSDLQAKSFSHAVIIISNRLTKLKTCSCQTSVLFCLKTCLNSKISVLKVNNPSTYRLLVFASKM